jgi:hypothetical protein
MSRFQYQVPGDASHERCEAATSRRCRVNLEESMTAVYSLIDELLGGVCA